MIYRYQFGFIASLALGLPILFAYQAWKTKRKIR